MRLYFSPAEYLNYFKLLGSFSKNCETSCSGGVTHCNLSRGIAKSRSCFYFLCNLQRNFSLRDQLQTWRVTRGSLPCNLQCNAMSLQVARKIASRDMAFRHANIKNRILRTILLRLMSNGFPCTDTNSYKYGV